MLSIFLLLSYMAVAQAAVKRLIFRESLDEQINRAVTCPGHVDQNFCTYVKNPRSSFSKHIQCRDITPLMLLTEGTLDIRSISVGCLRNLQRYNSKAFEEGIQTPDLMASISEDLWKQMPSRLLKLAMERGLLGLVGESRLRSLPPNACRKAVTSDTLKRLQGFPKALSVILETCYPYLETPTKASIVQMGMISSADMIVKLFSDRSLDQEMLAASLGELHLNKEELNKLSQSLESIGCSEMSLKAARRIPWLTEHASLSCLLHNPDLIQIISPARMNSLARTRSHPGGCILGSPIGNIDIDTVLAAFERFNSETTKWLITGCCGLVVTEDLIDHLSDQQVILFESICPVDSDLGRVLLSRRPGLLGLGSKGTACRHVYWRHFQQGQTEEGIIGVQLPPSCLSHLPPLTLGKVVKAMEKVVGSNGDGKIGEKGRVSPSEGLISAAYTKPEDAVDGSFGNGEGGGRLNFYNQLPWESFSNAQLSAIGTPRTGHIDAKLDHQLTFPVTLMERSMKAMEGDQQQ